MKPQAFPVVTLEYLLTGRGNQNKDQVVVRVDGHGSVFFSYGFPIARRTENPSPGDPEVLLDPRYWRASHTTAQYRCRFLGESGKETERKLKHGIYAERQLD